MHACVRCLSSPALDHMLVATVVMVSGSAFGRSVAWSFLSGRLRSPQRRMPEPQRQAGPVMGRDPHTGISPHADSVWAAIGRAYAAARWFLDEDGQPFHPSPSSILESSTSSGLFFSPAPRMPRRIPGAALGLESGHVVHVRSSEGWAFFGPTCCALTSGSPRRVAGASFFVRRDHLWRPWRTFRLWSAVLQALACRQEKGAVQGLGPLRP